MRRAWAVLAIGLLAGCGNDDEASFSGAAGNAGVANASAGSSNAAAGSAGVAAAGAATVNDAVAATVPDAPDTCPTIADGELSVLGQQVKIWTGPAGKKGPMVFYWHGTGGMPDEALLGLSAGLPEVRMNGGVVASFSTTTGSGENTGNGVWHVGDFEMADIIFACAVEQGLVDAARVYTAGCSAGGLQASVMLYARSSYLAAAMPNSGGSLREWELEDPAHVPALITTHGGPQDFVIISFPQATERLDRDVTAKGGFVVNCDHGGDHCASPDSVVRAQWQFLLAHPFGVEPEPYADALPDSFPDECQVIR